MVIYILTKFGANWLIFVDARVFTRKLWTDGRTSDGHRRTVSDHNSSLRTPCSGELIKKNVKLFRIIRGNVPFFSYAIGIKPSFVSDYITLQY